MDGRKSLAAGCREADGEGIGWVRLATVPDLSKKTLHDFIAQAVEPGSIVRTDGINYYLGLQGYVHDRQIQKRQPKGEHLGQWLVESSKYPS